MTYKFVTEAADYADFSSGRVLYNLPGRPAFPVRLMSEAFQRACAYLPDQAYDIYDPCCGAGYHLAVLGYLHGWQIRTIAGSDIDAAAVDVAARNLSLLTPQGVANRISEIEQMLIAYGRKASHQTALESAQRLAQMLPDLQPLAVNSFVANVFDATALQQGLNGYRPNLVFADVPYGQHSVWVGFRADRPALPQLFDSLHRLLTSEAIVMIAADKQQKLRHERFVRLERFQVGKRQIGIFQVAG